jgi:alanine dehydrogenase
VLALGLNTFDGVVTYPSVADAHGLPAASLEAVLA